MALFGNRKAAGRKRARQARRAAKQAARQARRAQRQTARQTTGRRARKAGRQQAKQTRRQTRIEGRVSKQAARQAGRTARTQAKAEGGRWDPESVKARQAALQSIVSTGAGLAETGISAATAGATGGLSALPGMLGDVDLSGLFGGGAEEDYAIPVTEQTWFWPVIIGGGVVLFLATRGGKKAAA